MKFDTFFYYIFIVRKKINKKISKIYTINGTDKNPMKTFQLNG